MCLIGSLQPVSLQRSVISLMSNIWSSELTSVWSASRESNDDQDDERDDGEDDGKNKRCASCNQDPSDRFHDDWMFLW